MSNRQLSAQISTSWMAGRLKHWAAKHFILEQGSTFHFLNSSICKCALILINVKVSWLWQPIRDPSENLGSPWTGAQCTTSFCLRYLIITLLLSVCWLKWSIFFVYKRNWYVTIPASPQWKRFYILRHD